MRYFGGKVRLAKTLAAIINQYDVQSYHEPFCGMFSVGAHVTIPNRSAADTHCDLIRLLKATRNGWVGPDTVTEEEYNALKDDVPSALRGFAGFGCSNSGKFFGGYARESTGRNFAANAQSSLLKLAPLIQGVRFNYQSYPDYDGGAELIYCDPPYVNTTGFTVGKFDTKRFWEWAREQARHSIVLVSEYVAPAGIQAVWQRPIRTDMNGSEGKIARIEKLFEVKA